MNAYELADDVKNISNTIEALEWVQKASPLLRQQADRIAELENQLDKCSHYEAMTHQEYMQQIKELELKLFKATNRAIATRKKLSKVKKEKIRAYDNGYEDGQKANTQLHPLTDEEIEQIAVKWYVGSRILPIGFARAILKKASEK